MCTNNILERLIADENEIHFFGFSSTDLITQFQRAIHETVKETHADMEECIIRKLKISEEDKKLTLRNEMSTLTERYLRNAEVPLQKVGEAVRNAFKIPPCLLEDNSQNEEEEYHKLVKEVQDLEKEYMKKKTFIELCEQELETINRIEPSLQKTQKLINKIEKMPRTLKDANVVEKLENMCNKTVEQFDTEHEICIRSKTDYYIHSTKFKTTTNLEPLDIDEDELNL